MSAPILTAEGVSKDFRGLRALDRVDFQVTAGTITAIIGPNGAGKTTLFNVIAGDFPPTAGRVMLQGRAISRLSADRVCRLGISRTYQAVRPFLGLSVWNNVKVALLYGRGGRPLAGSADAEIRDVLEFAHLNVAPDKLASGLTPLERKRLELARALATAPRILLLDEIVAGLSPSEALEMMETIRAINERGVTILLIEHVMKAVMGLSSHVIVLHHGEKIAEGNPADISRDERVLQAYLGDAIQAEGAA